MADTVRWLSFFWSPERQEIACDGERFVHPIATNTAASHDVAHLLAAAGGLAWRPNGTRDEVSAAEFNAVFLEHFAGVVLNALLLRRGSLESALARTLEHARWFLEVHYAPFFCTFDEAMATLAKDVDAEAVARLSPVFFRVRIFELEHEDYMSRRFSSAFSSRHTPRATGVLLEAKEAVGRGLGELRYRAKRASSRITRETSLS